MGMKGVGSAVECECTSLNPPTMKKCMETQPLSVGSRAYRERRAVLRTRGQKLLLRDEFIRTDTVVSHRLLGSGRIVVVDEENVIVDFASAREHLMSRDEAKKTLSRLDEQGLEARLFLAPEETRRWVDEAPLRLVAATLVDAGRRRAKTKDIRERLSPAVVDHETWNRWWGRVQNKLKDSPQFDYDAWKGTRLRSPANEVDSVSFSELSPPSKNTQTNRKPSSAATRFAEWVIWIQSEEPGEMPRGQGPPDALISVINNMPETITPRVVRRLADAVELRVLAPKKSFEISTSLCGTICRGSLSLDRVAHCPGNSCWRDCHAAGTPSRNIGRG